MKAKKLLSLLLSVLMVFSALPVPAHAAGNQSEPAEMSSEDFSKIASSDVTLASLFQFDRDLPRYNWGSQAPAPARFKGVTYALADNVMKVNSNVTKNILSVQQVENPNTANTRSISSIIGQGGLYKADQLKAATGLSVIKPGSVFVDTENNLAFKVPSLPDQSGGNYQGYVPVTRPNMQEVIKDFNVPAQTVRLNQSNVTHFVKDANGNSLDKYLQKPGQTYVMSQNSTMEPIKPAHLKDIIAEFRFPEEGVTLNGSTPSGGLVSVNIKGYLGIGDMDLDGYYEKWKYGFWFSVAEEIQLQATVAMELQEEVRIPILGVDVSFDSDIGGIAGGLFIVVGVNGKFTLQMEARQWTKLNKVGLKGKCIFYVPCTISPLRELGDCGFYLDSHFNGAIDGYVKGGALLELNLFGLDIIGAGVFAGMGVDSAVSGEYIETDLYGLVQAYVKFLGKQKYVLNLKPNILHKKQVNSGGYIVTFKEVCGYRDEVWGTLQYDAGVKGIVPEPGKDITLFVRKPGAENDAFADGISYPSKTDENGNFHLSGVALHKDDEVFIHLQEKDGTNYVNSAVTHPTFPFNKVTILEADFFNDYVKGYVPSAFVKDWSTENETKTANETEIVFDSKKSPDSSMKVNGVPVTLDSHGFFNLTGINVLPGDLYSCELTFDGWVVKSTPTIPTVDFSAQSVRLPVSYKRTLENNKPADVSATNETVTITNNRGTKVYTGDATFTVSGYTQAATACYIINPKTGLPIMQALGLPAQTQPVKAYAVQGTEEGSLGASYFTNSITKKWIWEPKPALAPTLPARPGIIQIKPSLVTPPSAVIGPTVPNATIIRLIDPDLSKLLPNLPQHSFTLSYDDNFDKYSDYEYYNNTTGRMENYSEQVDGTRAIKWDGKIVITYEGAEIILEIKDERRDTSGDAKFETLPADWLNKDVESMLNRYMEKMGGSLVFPIPDEMNRSSGIANIGALPAWSKQAAQKMVALKIMDLGTGQTFKSGTVTRGECAAYLVHAFGIAPDMRKSVFSDIVPANPYIPEINAAVSYGLINGYSKVSFGPGDPVTREQMAVMVIRGLKKKMGSRLSIPSAGKSFTDIDNFSSWSGTAINEISALRIMNGYPDGSFGAKDNITFDEMAVMLNNLHGFLNK